MISATTTARRRPDGSTLLAVVFTFLTLLMAALPAAAADPSTSGYRLGSGDRVRVIVFGHEDLTGEFQVDGSGNLAFPLIGAIEAGGKTAAELEMQLVKKLDPDFLRNPSVSVEIMTYRPFYIVGEVKNPGSYPYVSGMTVINAIALAGGFTYRAREDDFYITRADGDKQSRQRADPFTVVRPGDVITVRERYF